MFYFKNKKEADELRDTFINNIAGQYANLLLLGMWSETTNHVADNVFYYPETGTPKLTYNNMSFKTLRYGTGLNFYIPDYCRCRYDFNNVYTGGRDYSQLSYKYIYGILPTGNYKFVKIEKGKNLLKVYDMHFDMSMVGIVDILSDSEYLYLYDALLYFDYTGISEDIWMSENKLAFLKDLFFSCHRLVSRQTVNHPKGYVMIMPLFGVSCILSDDGAILHDMIDMNSQSDDKPFTKFIVKNILSSEESEALKKYNLAVPDGECLSLEATYSCLRSLLPVNWSMQMGEDFINLRNNSDLWLKIYLSN